MDICEGFTSFIYLRPIDLALAFYLIIKHWPSLFNYYLKTRSGVRANISREIAKHTSLNFYQIHAFFLGKNGQNNRLVSTSLELAFPRLDNPGSSTVNYIIFQYLVYLVPGRVNSFHLKISIHYF